MRFGLSGQSFHNLIIFQLTFGYVGIDGQGRLIILEVSEKGAHDQFGIDIQDA